MPKIYETKIIQKHGSFLDKDKPFGLRGMSYQNSLKYPNLRFSNSIKLMNKSKYTGVRLCKKETKRTITAVGNCYDGGHESPYSRSYITNTQLFNFVGMRLCQRKMIQRS